jgi:hypothetical protein
MHGTGQKPGPESGDGRRIEAKEMPPFGEIVETLSQSSVYCRGSGEEFPKRDETLLKSIYTYKSIK